MVVWLFAEVDRIPASVRQRIDEAELFVSPMVRLELSLLAEIGRVRLAAEAFLNALQRDLDLQVEESRMAALCRDRRSPQLDTRSVRPADRRPRHRIRRSLGGARSWTDSPCCVSGSDVVTLAQQEQDRKLAPERSCRANA